MEINCTEIFLGSAESKADVSETCSLQVSISPDDGDAADLRNLHY
jgi:hypothetical protein